MKKKFFLSYLFAAMFLWAFAGTDDSGEWEYIRYSRSSPYYGKGYVILSKYVGQSTHVTIPQYLNISSGKYYVNEIYSSLLHNCSHIVSVSLGNISDIPSSFFSGCTSLETVSGNVFSIGANALSGCTHLKSFDGLSSVKIIDKGAFANCTSLISFSAPNLSELGEFAFANCTSLTSFEALNLSRLDNFAFKGCTGLKSCTIGGSTMIPPGVFEGCSSLEKVELLGNTYWESWKIIGNFRDDFRPPFSGCSNLSEVTLGSGFTKIPEDTFRDLPLLTNVTVTTSLGRIGNNAFNGCTSLRSVIGSEGVNFVDSSAFQNCTSLESISFGAVDIGIRAFNGCSQLREVSVGGYSTIGNNAFEGCIALESLKGSSSVTDIGDNAFNGCLSLEVFEGFSSVTNIGASAFSGCTSLKDVTIEGGGDCVIYDKAFSECSSLETCILGKGVSALNYGTWSTANSPFYNCTNLKNVVLANISTVPQFLLPNHDILERVEMPNATRIDQDAFSGCPMLRNISSLANVTNIGRWAFRGCGSVTGTVDLSSAEIISEGAFKDCSSLTSVNIGKTIQTLGGSVFSGCTLLKDATIEGAGDCVINEAAFSGCSSLETCILGKGVSEFSYTTWRTEASPFYNCTNLKTVVLENISTVPQFLLPNHDILERVEMPNATRIDQDAFSGCPMLRNISSLANVTNIGRWAFRGCGSVTGTVDLSSAEIISEGAFKDCVNITGKVDLVKLKTVESGIFSGCERIRQVKFGKDLEVVRADAFSGSTNLIAFTFEGLPPEADNNAFRNVKMGALGIYPGSTLQLDDSENLLRSAQSLSETSDVKEWCDVIAEDGTWKKLLMCPNKPILTNDVYNVDEGSLRLNWETNMPPKEYGLTYEIRRGFSDNYDTADILTNGYKELTYIDKQFDFTGGVSRIWYWVKPEHPELKDDELQHSDACRTKNRYGVSVGASDNGADRDAERFASLAHKNGFEGCLFHALPQTVSLRDKISDYSDKLKPGDIFCLFIGAHGDAGNALIDPSLEMGGFWGDLWGAYSASELKEDSEIVASKNARFIGIIMACHAQAMILDGKLVEESEALEKFCNASCGEGSNNLIAWIASSRKDQLSYGSLDHSRFGRSFIKYGWGEGYADVDLWLEGVKEEIHSHGDGRITLLELAHYAAMMAVGGASIGLPVLSQDGNSSVYIQNPKLMANIDMGEATGEYVSGQLEPPKKVFLSDSSILNCTINWSSVENATTYRVYRYADNPNHPQAVHLDVHATGLDQISVMDVLFRGFRNRGTYKYYVQSENPAGLSKRSNIAEEIVIKDSGIDQADLKDMLIKQGINAEELTEDKLERIASSDLDGDGISVEHEYISGVSPRDSNSQFTANITMENGKPKVTPNPDLGDKRKYTIYGKKDLSSSSVDWTDMSAVQETEKPEYRFFKVGVSLP